MHLRTVIYLDRINQGPSHILKTNMHFIEVLQPYILTKAEGTCTKKMNVQLPGYTVLVVFEVVVLKVCQTV
jgi:hypothetical protein